MPDILIPVSDAERVERALAMVNQPDEVFYFLDQEEGMRNGGRDPRAPDCASHWTDGNGKEWATTDCIGFAMYVVGGSRRQRVLFPHYGGAINTDSILIDARGPRALFRPCRPKLGALLVLGGTFATVDGKRKRTKPGHVLVVVGGVPAEMPTTTDELFDMLLVAHASPSNKKKVGRAIATTPASVVGERAEFIDFVPPWDRIVRGDDGAVLELR
jgi:hypothetical protein